MLDLYSDSSNDTLVEVFFWIWFSYTMLVHLIGLALSAIYLYKQIKSVDVDLYVIHEYGLVILLWSFKIMLVFLWIFKLEAYGVIILFNCAYYFIFFLLEYLNFMKTYSISILAKIFNEKINQNRNNRNDLLPQLTKLNEADFEKHK